MPRMPRNSGFSLVEVLLVLAILGIISSISIPTYLGQRRRARIVGDAIANAQTMRMLLETRKADNGIYGTVGSVTWTLGTASDATFLPGFNPRGNSHMNFIVEVTNSGLAYTLTCIDPSNAGGTTVYQTNQNGAELARLR